MKHRGCEVFIGVGHRHRRQGTQAKIDSLLTQLHRVREHGRQAHEKMAARVHGLRHGLVMMRKRERALARLASAQLQSERAALVAELSNNDTDPLADTERYPFMFGFEYTQ